MPRDNTVGKRLGPVALVLLLLLAGCESSTSTTSEVREGYDFGMLGEVAIVDVVGEVHGEAAKNQIADLFTMQLVRRGFAPIQRQLVMRQLQDNGFDRGDLSPEVYAVEAGRVLRVPAVLIVSVPTFGIEPSITAKILEVQNGSALWIGSGTTGDGALAWHSTRDQQFQDQFGGSIFANPTMGNQRADLAVAGKPMDTALTPAEVEQLKAIIEDICKKIPHRTQKGQPDKDSKWWPW